MQHAGIGGRLGKVLLHYRLLGERVIVEVALVNLPHVGQADDAQQQAHEPALQLVGGIGPDNQYAQHNDKG